MNQENKGMSSILDAKASNELAQKILEELEIVDPEESKARMVLEGKKKDDDDEHVEST